MCLNLKIQAKREFKYPNCIKCLRNIIVDLEIIKHKIFTMFIKELKLIKIASVWKIIT